MAINTYTAPMYLVDDVDLLINSWLHDKLITEILDSFKKDLYAVHELTVAVRKFESTGNKTDFITSCNQHKSKVSMNLYGSIT